MPLFKILVTGAGGMIGKRLLPALMREGHTVIASGRKMPPQADRRLKGDLLVKDNLKRAMDALSASGGASVIIHLAGSGRVSGVREEELKRNNIDLTLKLLKAAREYGVKRFFFASTGMVYGRTCRKPAAEDTPLSPLSPYGSSKLKAEELTRQYSGLDMSSEIVRMSNVYGPDSPEYTVVGRLLSQIRAKREVSLSSLAPVRDFIYIDDVISAFLSLVALPSNSGCTVTNLSTGIGTAIGQLLNMALSSASLPLKKHSGESSPDINILSNKFLISRTGWYPRYTLSNGLKACLNDKR